MPLTVTEVQPTPNPNALKFVLDRHITQERLSFVDSQGAKDHPLATRLFEIGGVKSLLLLGDFVTVVKSPAVKWGSITAKVKKVLAASSPESK
jgi:NFU1 iron-sulfur cluster scaffold homolog, mitochondrial